MRRILAVIIALVVIGLGAWYLIQRSATPVETGPG